MKRILAVSSLLLLSPCGFAQSGRVRDGAPDKQVIRLKAEEVLLPVSLRGRDGKPPSSLPGSDFVVLEDDKKRQITSIERMPSSILFLLDTGGEDPQFKRINMNRDLALEIIGSLGVNDQAAIVTYSESARLIAPWTGDKQALREALRWKFRPGLGSHLYDALTYAAEEVLPKAPGLRSVVLLTDGMDFAAYPAMEKIRESLHRARATLYAASQSGFMLADIKPRAHHALDWYEMIDAKARKRIEYLRVYERKLDTGQGYLADLVEETGGMIWAPPTREEFAHVAPIIVQEIGTEVVIAYSTERPASDTEPHTVSVSSSRPDITVRARRRVYSSLPVDSAKNGEAKNDK